MKNPIALGLFWGSAALTIFVILGCNFVLHESAGNYLGNAGVKSDLPFEVGMKAIRHQLNYYVVGSLFSALALCIANMIVLTSPGARLASSVALLAFGLRLLMISLFIGRNGGSWNDAYLNNNGTSMSFNEIVSSLTYIERGLFTHICHGLKVSTGCTFIFLDALFISLLMAGLFLVFSHATSRDWNEPH